MAHDPHILRTINGRIAELYPRRATVTEVAEEGVRVRVQRDGAEHARLYRSVISNVPVGTEGILVRISREDTMFIPEGVVAVSGPQGPEGPMGPEGPQGEPGAVGPAGTTTWAGITDKPASFTPSSHTHVVADTTGLQAALDGKAATSHTHDDRYYTESEVNTLIADHTGNTSNPHSVTKAQVGLGNVDNTSDASKPISTATQAALDAKVVELGFAVSNTPVNTTTVTGTYSSMPVLLTNTLSGHVPAITTGTWNVLITISALVYRSVADGGVYVSIGNGSSGTSSLGRNFTQSNGYTLTGTRTYIGIPPSATIDFRFAGFSTAGTTNVVTYNIAFTANRTA